MAANRSGNRSGNRFWQLDRRPQGLDFASALSFRKESLAPLVKGEVRIATQYLSMDAGTRMWMGPRTDGYQPPLPPGVKMQGLELGRVRESRDAAFSGTRWCTASGNGPTIRWSCPRWQASKRSTSMSTRASISARSA